MLKEKAIMRSDSHVKEDELTYVEHIMFNFNLTNKKIKIQVKENGNDEELLRTVMGEFSRMVWGTNSWGTKFCSARVCFCHDHDRSSKRNLGKHVGRPNGDYRGTVKLGLLATSPSSVPLQSDWNRDIQQSAGVHKNNKETKRNKS